VIDLHLHTTASDGQLSPEALIERVAHAGCRVVAVTDHDTVAGIEPAAAAAGIADLTFISGIEMTAVAEGVDVHILGYFIDIRDPALAAFLVAQRERRRQRVRDMGERLAELGAAIDIAQVLALSAESGRSVGRPAVAQALVTAGHAATVPDAFDRFLAEGRPAYLPRTGPGPEDVIERIRQAGGVASLAHPGKLRRDHLIPPMVAAGLEALEVYHSDHTVIDVVRYQTMADRLGVLVTGGSDYHGPDNSRAGYLGQVGLPPSAFDRLLALTGRLR
jgi:predicted metal-dependent phosphoesterase TrpH